MNECWFWVNDALGLRIPSTFPRPDLDSSLEATAIRAVAEQCDIDDDEYYVLSAIPPIKIFPSPENSQQTKEGGRERKVGVL